MRLLLPRGTQSPDIRGKGDVEREKMLKGNVFRRGTRKGSRAVRRNDTQ